MMASGWFECLELDDVMSKSCFDNEAVDKAQSD